MSCQLIMIFRSTRNERRGISSTCRAWIDALNRRSTIGITIRLVLLIAPPAFYLQILMPCWECYDFEAAATHEVGHILGLSHPDAVASALCTSSDACGRAPGVNSYHRGLAAGLRFNNETCRNPWDDVMPGVPPDVPETELADGVRHSIMRAFTQHNPEVGSRRLRDEPPAPSAHGMPTCTCACTGGRPGG